MALQDHLAQKNPIEQQDFSCCFSLKRLKCISIADLPSLKSDFFKYTLFDSLLSPAFLNKMYALFAAASMILQKSGHLIFSSAQKSI